MIHLIGAEQHAEDNFRSFVLKDKENNSAIHFFHIINADSRWSTVTIHPQWPGQHVRSLQDMNGRILQNQLRTYIMQKCPIGKRISMVRRGLSCRFTTIALPPSDGVFNHTAYTTNEHVAIPLSAAQVTGSLNPTDQTMKILCTDIFSVYMSMYSD